MKNSAFVFLALTGILGIIGHVSAQSTQTRPVSGFNSVGNAGSFAVHVKITGTESLKITADASIIDEIETVVEGGNLEVRFKHPHEQHHYNGRVDVYITAKALNALACSGSGSIEVDGALKGNEADVTLSGSGSITTSIASGKVEATISGSGKINLNGSTGKTNVTISGSGDLKAGDLKTDVAEITTTGSGTVHINANKSISAEIIGSGNVYYTGTANISKVSTIGSGRIKKE
jgi:Putative auto-transporter adhesin, head GIN domain